MQTQMAKTIKWNELSIQIKMNNKIMKQNIHLKKINDRTFILATSYINISGSEHYRTFWENITCTIKWNKTLPNGCEKKN